MRHRTNPHHDLIYNTAKHWVRCALETDDSLFTPGKPIWTLQNVKDLYNRTGPPYTAQGNFEEKLKRQLNNAPAETIQLAAETLYIFFLMPIPAKNKRSLIDKVLSWADQPVTIPEELAGTLEYGRFSLRPAFSTYRYALFSQIISFLMHWKQLEPNLRNAALEDGWLFKRKLYEAEIAGANTQLNTLLHIVHPETFEGISSINHKKRIAGAFQEHIEEGHLDVDQQLKDIRAALKKRNGGEEVCFYTDPILRAKWHPSVLK